MSTPETPQAGAFEQEAPVCYRHPDREAHIRCQRCERRICPDCMRPASVGFQCPSCVAEGSKATRSGGTPYGGQRAGNPALTSQVIIAINVLVWVLVLATGGNSSRIGFDLALMPASVVLQHHYWQLLTTAFLHVQVWHIGFNMLALYTLGPQLELAVGRARFLALYVLSALTASAAVMWFAPSYSLTLGASGAIFGLMGALLVVAVKVRGDVRGMLTWIGVNFAFTLLLVNQISWQGHTGGFVGGLLIGAALAYAPRGPARARYQALALAGIALVTLAAIVARVLVLAG